MIGANTTAGQPRGHRCVRWLAMGAMLGAIAAVLRPASAQPSTRPAHLLPLPPPTNGLSYALSWQADTYENVAGGLRRGNATDSVLYAGFRLDTGALGAWQGGRLNAQLQAIRSTNPSAYAGDLQTLSNLTAPNQTEIAALWYSQSIGDLLLRGGIINLNAYFNVNNAAQLYPNSSFGIIPTISANVPSSIYPNFGWGMMAQIGKAEGDWRFGLFQGNPSDRSSVLRDGAMLITERDWRDRHSGSHLQLGAWYRGAPQPASAPTRDWGAYANVERHLPHSPDTTAFLQLGLSPPATNPVPIYLGTGLHFHHVAPAVSDIAVGIARAWIRDHAAETSIEATVSFPFSRGAAFLQPDLQYILHPSGIYPNALVVGLRVGLTFY